MNTNELRQAADIYASYPMAAKFMRDAADEIDRLGDVMHVLDKQNVILHADNDDLKTDVERLTAERDAQKELAGRAADVIRDLVALVPGQRFNDLVERAQTVHTALRQAKGE